METTGLRAKAAVGVGERLPHDMRGLGLQPHRAGRGIFVRRRVLVRLQALCHLVAMVPAVPVIGETIS
jgi:hypothetical protein